MTTKSCVYCGSEIPVRATVCSACKYHQSSLRNNFLFAAGLVGLFTLIASALAFTTDHAERIYKNIAWRDHANILDFQNVGKSLKIVLANDGEGSIFVSDVMISYRGNLDFIAINKVLEPNNISLIEEKDDAFVGAAVVVNKSGIPTQQIIEDVQQGLQIIDIKKGFGNQFCILSSFYSSSNAGLTMMKNFYAKEGGKIVSEDAIAYVGYFSYHSKKRIETEFPIVATFLMSNQQKCISKFRN